MSAGPSSVQLTEILTTKHVETFSRCTLREERNRIHLATFVLHHVRIGHRQMKMVPMVRFVGFCLCTNLINGQLTSTFSIRPGMLNIMRIKEGSSGLALL